jgi:hypothetical protein
MPEPVTDRPIFPEGYGIPESTDGMLTWAQVEERLVASPVYWIATVRPDGRPHVVPRWGVWVDGRLWYDGAPTTVNARNLAGEPRCVVHLENGTEAVIVEGESRVAGDPGEEFRGRLAEAFAKYHGSGYSPGPDSWEGERGQGLFAFTPSRAMAWFSFPTDATRFTFRPG